MPAHAKHRTVPTRTIILRQATNTSGYRGSHETPWIINRFAHVAREPEILDVCLLRFIEQYLYVAEYRDIGIFSQNFGRKRAATTRNPMSCKQKLSITHMMFSNLRKAEFLTMKGKACLGGSGMRTAREISSLAFHTGGGGLSIEGLTSIFQNHWHSHGRYAQRFMFLLLPSDSSSEPRDWIPESAI